MYVIVQAGLQKFAHSFHASHLKSLTHSLAICIIQTLQYSRHIAINCCCAVRSLEYEA